MNKVVVHLWEGGTKTRELESYVGVALQIGDWLKATNGVIYEVLNRLFQSEQIELLVKPVYSTLPDCWRLDEEV